MAVVGLAVVLAETPYLAGDREKSIMVIFEGVKECDFCESEVDELHSTSMPGGAVERGDLCDVCFGSFAGNALFYPEQYPVMILRTMSQQTNMILKAFKESR